MSIQDKSPTTRWALALLIIVITVALMMTWIALGDNVIPKAQAADTTQRVEQLEPGSGGWNRRVARKFRHNKIGHSTHRTVPLKVRRKLNHYAATHRVAARSLNERGLFNWWMHELSNDECMVNMTTWGALPGIDAIGSRFCWKYGRKPGVRKINREITYVKVVCGGTAALATGGAAVAGGIGAGPPGAAAGAVVGFGFGAGTCMYDRYASMFVNALP